MIKTIYINFIFPFFLLLIISLISCNDQPNTPENTRPNILLIVADDLGFTDLGCYGSEIRTPNIDALAKSGIRNTSFCTAPTCSPTRAMLLTGTTAHLSGLGTMAGDWSDNQKGQKGYEAYLNFDVVTFPKLLQQNGYQTSITGKWHLAYPPPTKKQWAYNRGFDKSFCMMQGGGGHFHDKQPFLSFIKEALYTEDDDFLGELPKDFYSSTFYVDKTISYIQESVQKDKPFFHFLSFTAPHWPLQVPDKYLNLYKGKYDDGYEKLAETRFSKAQKMGLIPENAQLPPLSPNVKPWKDLTETEQKQAAKNMEIYAAMIEVLDMETGRLIEYLKKENLYENTIIIFMSDNGAEGNSIMTYEGTGEWVDKTFDNSWENQGRINSYLQLDAAWAQVASLPFKWYKAFAHEGGVRAPAIFSYPKWTTKTGEIHHDYLSVMDIAPTILELTNTQHPETIFEGRKIYPMQGKSMLNWLSGKADLVHAKEAAHAWELFGRVGVRAGDWKAEKIEAPYGTGDWELYNLKDDIIQENNLAKSNPEKMQEMIQHWEIYKQKNNVIMPDRPTAYSKETYWNEK